MDRRRMMMQGLVERVQSGLLLNGNYIYIPYIGSIKNCTLLIDIESDNGFLKDKDKSYPQFNVSYIAEGDIWASLFIGGATSTRVCQFVVFYKNDGTTWAEFDPPANKSISAKVVLRDTTRKILAESIVYYDDNKISPKNGSFKPNNVNLGDMNVDNIRVYGSNGTKLKSIQLLSPEGTILLSMYHARKNNVDFLFEEVNKLYIYEF